MNKQFTNESASDSGKSKTTFMLVLFVLLLILLAVLLFTCRSQRQSGTTQNAPKTGAVAPPALQIPAVKPGEAVVSHTGYSFLYNEPHEQAAWVAYVMRGSQLEGKGFARTNQFTPDPLVNTGTADDADYNGSGYDRGHLASAEDMSWSAETMRESFYYSNMSPQVPAFNRGVWKRLEELIRYWSSAYDSVYTVTGPVLTEGLPAIGHNSVSVPHYFYRVVLEYNSKGAQGIGFVMPNEASAATLKSFAVSIDSVERLTGLDFFPRLPDDVEEKIESRVEEESWLWKRVKK